nr:phosphoadenosine phosphosulfate reductase family protein [uncultured Desulfobulbus sp.]
MNNVISLSGGKDSTAMLHMMLDRGEQIHSAVFFDTGWEFPEMVKHIDLVEQKTGLKVVRLEPEEPFDYWMYEWEMKKKQAGNVGYGWPNHLNRWCTGLKTRQLDKRIKQIENAVVCVGIAADELHRVKSGNKRYPLIEYGVTEEQALEYCRKLGYTWGGLYDIFNRVSCWCCPLQSLPDLRSLRKYRPELWSQLLKMDTDIPTPNRGFNGYKTVADLEHRFSTEDKIKPFYNGKVSRRMLRFIKPHSQQNLFTLI